MKRSEVMNLFHVKEFYLVTIDSLKLFVTGFDYFGEKVKEPERMRKYS